jgi:hypothetical protein
MGRAMISWIRVYGPESRLASVVSNDERASRQLRIADEKPTNEMVRRLIRQP